MWVVALIVMYYDYALEWGAEKKQVFPQAVGKSETHPVRTTPLPPSRVTPCVSSGEGYHRITRVTRSEVRTHSTMRQVGLKRH